MSSLPKFGEKHMSCLFHPPIEKSKGFCILITRVLQFEDVILTSYIRFNFDRVFEVFTVFTGYCILMFLY